MLDTIVEKPKELEHLNTENDPRMVSEFYRQVNDAGSELLTPSQTMNMYRTQQEERVRQSNTMFYLMLIAVSLQSMF